MRIKLRSKLHEINVKHLFPIFIVLPFISEYFEDRHFPIHLSDWLTEIVTTIIISLAIILINYQYRSLEKLSLTDHLTGIPNRRQFELDLKREIFRARRRKNKLILIFLDLDGFKQVNDLYGHAVGDEVLIIFSQALSQFIRRGSDFCYRFGGDEFAVLLTDIENDMTVSNEQILEKRLSELFAGKLSYGVSVSMGIIISEGVEEFDELVKRADSKMYEIKRKKSKR